jgi:hypothetical protein
MTKRRVRCVLLAALSIMVVASLRVSFAEQVNAGTIRGVAMTALRQPLMDHVVRLRSLDGVRPVRLGRTNTTGAYEFNAVAPGIYCVEVVDRSSRVVTTDGPITVSKDVEQHHPVRIALMATTAASMGAIAMGVRQSGTASQPQSSAVEIFRGTSDEVVTVAVRAGIGGVILTDRPIPSGPR